jgi:hypothetical protein
MPFTTREETHIGTRRPRPTSLSSDRIKKAWDERIKEEALFGARITHKSYLDALKKVLAQVTGGYINPQQAERRLREALQGLGYTPQAGFGDGKAPPAKPMSIQDLSSSRRIQLIIDTNVKRARSMGQVAASENPLTLMALPAWRLTRTGARKKPRGNWLARWKAAGDKCGWEGASKREMVALKTSPIWAALGQGVGGYDDAIGSPYPPFAFGSGMAWVNVGRREWRKICKAEGIDDGLEAVTEKAREFRDSDKASIFAPSKPQKVEPALPTPAPKGADNPLETPAAPPAPTTAYLPDYTARDEANDAIDDAIEEMDGKMQSVREAQAEVKKMADEAETTGPRYRELALRRLYARIALSLRELESLRGRIVNYGGAVASEPPPTDAARQSAYDEAMRRYEAATKRTLGEAEREREGAVRQRRAADEVLAR